MRKTIKSSYFTGNIHSGSGRLFHSHQRSSRKRMTYKGANVYIDRGCQSAGRLYEPQQEK